MANLVESFKGLIHSGTNFLPNKSSHHEIHGIPVTPHGNPALTHQPVYCPTLHFETNVLNPLISKENHQFWTLEGSWDANITIPPWLLYPSVFVATVTLFSVTRTWTTPSAQALVSYIVSQGEVFRGGSYWQIYLGANENGLLLVAGAGCVIRGNFPYIISPDTHRTLGIRIVDTRPGSEAYEIYLI